MGTPDTRASAIFLMGPTASGKTALACALAARFGVDLVSVDSALVYRGMDIGTAKPDAATLRAHPHRLIDIRDPHEPYSAAEFRVDALREMDEIHARGRVPLLVGGTGLYFRALERGLSDLPSADVELRAELAAEAQRYGWPHLHARLHKLDAAAAARIGPADGQRIQRALEVIALSGRPLSTQQGGRRARLPCRVLKLALLPEDRVPLHARIASRFDAMLADGFLDEVRVLRGRADLAADLPAMRAVGYRQAAEHLDGHGGDDEFRARAIAATRQLAKRQITWLRSEWDARVLDPDAPTLAARAVSAVADFLGGGN
jgi:tRNA dimethylallyltransferase